MEEGVVFFTISSIAIGDCGFGVEGLNIEIIFVPKFEIVSMG
jgi:hypothetical protein